MPLTMTIDGFDPSTIGFSITNADTRRVYPEREWVTERTVHRPNAILMSGEPVYDDRELIVEGILTGTSEANYEARRDELLARLDRDAVVEVGFSDTSRVFYTRLAAFDTEHRSMAKTANDDVEMTLQLLRPWAYDSSTSSVTTITSATAIPLGTAPTFDVTIRINGAFTNPTILYKDSSGTTVNTLSFTLSKSAGEWVDVNMLDGTIEDDAGDSQQAARDTNTDFPFPLDPRDGQHWNSAWPTLEVDSGELDVTYRKAYG